MGHRHIGMSIGMQAGMGIGMQAGMGIGMQAGMGHRLECRSWARPPHLGTMIGPTGGR